METFKCGHSKTKENMRSNGTRNGVKSYRCATCKRAANSKHQKENPEIYRKANSKWQKNNHEKYLERRERFLELNPDKPSEYSERHRRKIGQVEWGSPEMSQKMSESAKKRVERDGWLPTPSPSKLELDCKVLFEPRGYRHTGDGTFWIRGEDGKSKNPDFKKTGSKAVIEVWGDYWHRDQNPQDLIDWYSDNGYSCEIYWEHEVKPLLRSA